MLGVGTELAASAVRLSARDARAGVLVPGFPTSFRTHTSPDAALRGIAAGRFTAAVEHLKQCKLAAAGFGQAVKEAGDRMPAFDNVSIAFIGVEPNRVEGGELEALVRDRAGKMVNVVPFGFELDPIVVTAQLSQSNLAIMPSYREGFGLAGWEAIGCQVPLVLGTETGLYKFIEAQLGGAGTGCVYGVRLNGGISRKTMLLASQLLSEILGETSRGRRPMPVGLRNSSSPKSDAHGKAPPNSSSRTWPRKVCPRFQIM